MEKLFHRIKNWFHYAYLQAKEGGAHVGSHQAFKMMVESPAAAQTVSGSTGGFIAGMTHSVGAVAGLGFTAAVSAGLVQMEYNDNKKHIKELYKDEMSAKLGKSEKTLKPKDLEILANGDAKRGIEGNRTFKEALDKQKKKRNLGVVLAVVATLTSLALMGVATQAGMFGAIGIPAVKFIAEGVVGLLTYNAIKTPLNWAGEKIFGLNRETTHDRIEALIKEREDGRTITREQVFSVFVAANRELSDFIEAKYGKTFDKLGVAEKLTITQNIGKLIHIGELTDNINLGHLKITELAFVVEGQESGVGLKAESTKHGLLSAIKTKLSHLVQRVSHHGQLPEEEAAVEFINEAPRQSFVSRLGLTRADTQLGHVERLQQSAGEVTPNVTIH